MGGMVDEVVVRVLQSKSPPQVELLDNELIERCSSLLREAYDGSMWKMSTLLTEENGMLKGKRTKNKFEEKNECRKDEHVPIKS